MVDVADDKHGPFAQHKKINNTEHVHKSAFSRLTTS